MQYRLRTLWALMTLAAIVAAAFGVNVLWGIFAYLACFTLFMVAWRINAVGHDYDAHPPTVPDPRAPARILLTNMVIGLLAALVFCGGCTFTQMSVGPPLLVPADRLAEMQAKFNRDLWLSIPLGTAAALFCYWLSWPSGEK